MRILLKRPHINGCFMTPGSGLSPWVQDRRNPSSYGDKTGGNRGQTTSWLRWRCNDPSCTALVLVNEWDLSELIAEWLQ